jgi:hypothetical protein
MREKFRKPRPFAGAFFTIVTIASLSTARADPPAGCTTVAVTVSGGDWVPSADYQPCGAEAGHTETWYLPWEVRKTGYTVQKDVASNSTINIGRPWETCGLSGRCTSFTVGTETLQIECCGCIAPGLAEGCPNVGKSTDTCQIGSCSP